MTSRPTPPVVSRAVHQIGTDLNAWRKLSSLTTVQVAERAGISRHTVERLERGEGATLENVLRIGRALGVLDRVLAAFDPYETDVGRLRADEQLPVRVRRRA